MRPRDIGLISTFTAFTALGAQVAIPIGPVPITLQVLFVLLSGLVLGARLGFLSQTLYLLLGLLGFPVFAHLGSGFAVLYGPTGGYLLAFPLASFLAGMMSGRGKAIEMAGALLAIGAIYLLGWARLSLLIGPEKAFYLGVLPFVGVDVAKAVVAVLVANAVREALPEGRF
ncbi:biotin transporter BioY [Thermococcus gammatolerans]|uniref:Biotin biosynthesis protein, bioY (BioY) n=1 Tax=Thermococcus gammatolerans (strain DSM 15229 / JCM 11827 / EJ3) TaxID=593117 RepID=C5A1N7_THEGJ|nr:biotin transporter BioY [Thermococcus gammatolerans]ACS34306.1 Biotin biosynthesis protein, bioY (bioY) [Thermococcus gammatolerans EJ3]